MIKYSIIIPTAFDKLEELLKPCIESIIKYTDLNETEIIVVSNGATDGTDEYVRSLIPPVKLLSFPKAIGYPAAINEGTFIADGEFIIPFNNDNILLEQEKDSWIKILADPFKDPKVGISGPWLNWCPSAERDFLIFFCVMIRKSIFNELGELDVEAFSMGYGEDCDFCCKVEDAGYKIACIDVTSYDGNMGIGYFPIYHAGNKTFKNWPDGDKLLAHNRQILHDRYAGKSPNIHKALACDGFMSPEELTWLAKESKNKSIVIELGSWHGRSSRAIADNLPKDGVLYCLDTWQGSIAEQETNHISAKQMSGDHAYDEFCRNVWEHIESGKVIPLRMHGEYAAKLLLDKGIQADLIFIDGGHQYSEVQQDINSFLPLLKKDGVMSGHDFMQGLAEEVTPAVLDIFGKSVGNPPETTIWYTNYNPVIEINEKPKIYDCFTFFNELDVLEIRFNELYDTVDRFVISEARLTHQGDPKPLYFADNLQRFEKFLNKVTHIVVDFPDNLEEGGGPSFPSGIWWARERYQRERLMDGLTGCKDNDIIIISDGDEIPRASVIKNYKPEMGLMKLEQKLYYYFLNCYGGDWHEAKILPYGLLKQLSPCNTRYSLHTIGNQGAPLDNGGWHFSFLGGVDKVIEKIASYSHGEYATSEIMERERITRILEEGSDIFGREGFKYEFTEIDNTYPKYVLDNLNHFKKIGFIK